MIIWSSINCPTVICSPTVCYFSREKPLVKPTAPGSLSHIICLCGLFYLTFIFRSIKPKIEKYFAALYFIWCSIYQYLQLSNVRLPISGAVTWKGLTTPLTRRVASICYLCAGVVYVVLLGYPTGSITLVSSMREITTVATLYHPFLLGKYRRSSSRHQKKFLAPLPGRIFNIYQVPNHKSHLFTIYIICHLPLVFLSPTSQKFAILFAPLFPSPFSCFPVLMASVPTPPLSPDFEVLYFKQRQGENLKDAWYRLMESYRISNLKGALKFCLTFVNLIIVMKKFMKWFMTSPWMKSMIALILL